MDFIIWFYNQIGSGFCHQIAERTIILNGQYLPLCARDTGIYLGVILSAIFIFIRGRFVSDKPPRIIHTIIFCIMMIPMMYDGVTSYSGLRITNNDIRFFTGLLFGLPLPFFLIPLANYNIYGKNSLDVLKHTKELVILTITGIAAGCMVLYTDILPWFFVSSIEVSGIVFLIARIIYTIIFRLNRFGKLSVKVAAISFTAAFIIAMNLIVNNILRPMSRF